MRIKTYNFERFIYIYYIDVYKKERRSMEQKARSKGLHSPRLESIRMVENAVKRHSGKRTKFQLWRELPKSMMYQTYLTVLDYLLESGKITIDKGKIIWIMAGNFARATLKQAKIQNVRLEGARA